MIVRLAGTLLEKQPPFLILDVGGVGYGIEAPMSTFYPLPSVGAPCVLHTHLLVREDAQLLYGFWTLAERDLFLQLIKISGVGAKMALAILSNFEPKSFQLAIQRGEAGLLTRIPGVGKKTAERLVLELRNSKMPMPKFIDPNIQSTENPENTIHATSPEFSQKIKNKQNQEDAFAALVSLGYKLPEATQMLDKAAQQLPEDSSCEQWIRAALQSQLRLK